jgi:hypothetical protein
MLRNTKIYLVSNCYNDSNKVYIGKTINSTRKRDHMRKYGKDIDFLELEEIKGTDSKNWKPLETYWIQQFTQWGFDIQNTQKLGGSGVNFHSLESRNRIKQSKSLKPHPNMRKDIEFIKEDIIKQYESGDGVHIISKQLNCHSDVIKRILRENNITLRTPSQSQKSRKDLKNLKRNDLWNRISEIKLLYLEGKNYTELGKIFNTSDVQIKLMLKKENVI